MPIPDNFSPWEHLQSVLMKVHNSEVKEEFSDITDDDDISLPRSSLKQACLLKDNDTSEITLLRMMLFWFNLRKAKDLQPDFYGLNIHELQATRKYKPHIKLYFEEHLVLGEISRNRTPIDGEISFRLMNETSQSLTQANLTTFGNKIKALFGGNTPEKWHKGKNMASYTDRERGYQLQILTDTKQHAKDLITKVLDIQAHTPNWKYLNYKENEEPLEAFPNTAQTTTILGKSQKLPLVRPRVDVVFQHASIHIHGLPRAICLYDRTGSHLYSVVD